MDEQRMSGMENGNMVPEVQPQIEQADASQAMPIQPVSEPVTSEPVSTELVASEPVTAVPEHELDLDPDLTQIVTEQAAPVPPVTPITGEPVVQPVSDRVVDPIAPIMPQIDRMEYKPVEPQKTSRGMKVFAVIVAVMVLVSACVTGGYFLGLSRFGGAEQSNIDLAKKPDPDDAMTVSQVYEKANPSVVGIYIYNESGIAGTASGVIYSEDGYVVTNDHIYSDVSAPKFKVYTHDGKMLSAAYVAGDTRSDLAVLKIENASGLTAATFGNSDEVAVGEVVIAVGRPNGANQASTASEGIVSATARRIATTSSYNGRFIQTDSAINPGSSGGALYNLYGQVIGITSAKLVGDEYEGVGFAIPTTVMKNIVESLIANKTVKGRAKLGISYQAVDPLAAEMTGSPCGLKIAEIDQSSDLYGKAVGIGDVITHVNGTEITDSNLVLDIIEQSKPGDTLNLKVYSAENHNSFDISVKLLEDTGSSSYIAGGAGSNAGDTSSNGQYNSSEFNFPNGD